MRIHIRYRKSYNIKRIWVGNNIVDHSDVVGTSHEIYTQLVVSCSLVPDDLTHTLHDYFTGTGAMISLVPVSNLENMG